MDENSGLVTGLTTTIPRAELVARIDALIESTRKVEDDLMFLRGFVADVWAEGIQAVPVGAWLNSAEVRLRGVRQSVNRLKYDYTGEISDE